MSHYQPRSENISHPNKTRGVKPSGIYVHQGSLMYRTRPRDNPPYIETMPARGGAYINTYTGGSPTSPISFMGSKLKHNKPKKRSKQFRPKEKQPWV